LTDAADDNVAVPVAADDDCDESLDDDGGSADVPLPPRTLEEMHLRNFTEYDCL